MEQSLTLLCNCFGGGVDGGIWWWWWLRRLKEGGCILGHGLNLRLPKRQ